MIFDLLAPPQGAGPKKKCDVARHIHVSNTHTKFGWISSNGLGGDSVTEGPTDGRRRLQYPRRFFKKRGDNKSEKLLSSPFLWKVNLKILNSGIILKTITHASFQSQRLFMHAFLSSADFFLPKLTFSKNSGTLSLSNGLDLDQDQHVVIQFQNICD